MSSDNLLISRGNCNKLPYFSGSINRIRQFESDFLDNQNLIRGISYNFLHYLFVKKKKKNEK